MSSNKHERSNSIESSYSNETLAQNVEAGYSPKKEISNDQSLPHLDTETIGSFEDIHNDDKQEFSPIAYTINSSFRTDHSSPNRKTINNHRTIYMERTPIITPGVMSIPAFAPNKKYQITTSRLLEMMSPFNNVNLTSPVETSTPEHLSRCLKAHNIAAITLCSVFGTGLLIKTATTLAECGPFPLLIAFSVMLLLSYQVVSALCELCTYIPLPNAYSGYTERFVDPALGYALGYFYLFQYLIIGPNQIFAGALTVQYWIPINKVNPAVWITIFIVVLTLLNYIDVGKIAMTADLFVLAKMVAYFFMITLLLVIICGVNSKNDVIGFKYWKNPGAVNQSYYPKISNSGNGIVAIISAITGSIFPFVGIESFCVTVSEARYPRKTIPKAKRLLYISLSAFYIVIAFLIGLAVAYNDANFPRVIANQDKTTAASSPVILAVQNAGLKIIPSVLNGVIFIFVLSAANSSFYISTRILYGLSASGLAPVVFSKTTSRGIPVYSIGLIVGFNFLAYLGVSEPTRKLFELFSNSVCGFTMILWMCILLTHICFLRAMKVQNVQTNRTTYKARGGIIPSFIALTCCGFLIMFREFQVFLDLKNFDVDTFITGYICVPVFLVIFVSFKFYYKTKFIKAEDADLFFYKDCVDRSEEQYINEEVNMYSLREKTFFLKRWYYKLLV